MGKGGEGDKKKREMGSERMSREQDGRKWGVEESER
jgi:hypothetical protein